MRYVCLYAGQIKREASYNELVETSLQLTATHYCCEMVVM